MARLALTAVTRTQGANQALKDGTVQPDGFALTFEEVPVLIRAFRRMVRGLEFDVTEMAFTTYLCAKAHGKRFTALPIFLVRGFHHGAMVRRATSDLGPKQVEGAAVGVNRGYTVTTGVWARAILQDEHGVDLSAVTWAPSGDEHVAEYQPPDNVVPMPPGADLAESVAGGELAAGVGITADRPDLAPLIADPDEAGYRALRDRGFYPINHLVVVKDELLAAHPDLGRDLFTAFTEAKNRHVERLRKGQVADPSPTDRMHLRVMEITGGDPLPYGIAPNRPMIDELMRHAVNQRILERPIPTGALFAPGTHDLTG